MEWFFTFICHPIGYCYNSLVVYPQNWLLYFSFVSLLKASSDSYSMDLSLFTICVSSYIYLYHSSLPGVGQEVYDRICFDGIVQDMFIHCYSMALDYPLLVPFCCYTSL